MNDCTRALAPQRRKLSVGLNFDRSRCKFGIQGFSVSADAIHATIYSQQKAVNRQMLQDSLDWMLPGNTLGFGNLNEGALGLIGYVEPAVHDCWADSRYADSSPRSWACKVKQPMYWEARRRAPDHGYLGLGYVVQYQVVLSVYSRFYGVQLSVINASVASLPCF